MKCVIFNNPFRLISIFKVDGSYSGGGKPLDLLRSNRGQGEYFTGASGRPPWKKPENLEDDTVSKQDELEQYLNRLKEEDPALYSAYVKFLK